MFLVDFDADEAVLAKTAGPLLACCLDMSWHVVSSDVYVTLYLMTYHMCVLLPKLAAEVLAL